MRLNVLLRYLAFFWIAILSLASLEYWQLKPQTGFLQLKQAAVASGWYLPAFYSHIFGSSVILICGYFQFGRKSLEKASQHRVLGNIYVFGTLFFASPGAYVMSFFIDRGIAVLLSFLVQNTLWILSTVAAIYYIKKGNMKAHSDMAVRSYSLAFAAVTLRFYVWLFNIFGNGADFQHNYVIIALLSWVPNLLIAEFLIRRKVYSAAIPGDLH
ncbi:DUF2306 domain-containing protein [Desertivirga arenae]|uniref:DUF2306 domain-containing protein n=1 Tax=Desertivirga arenae TaxID=2810309 RepID=UPI001A958A6D|nr:DUF2306 domain-containing protein [Pedobacter sp. SYSU D00823]